MSSDLFDPKEYIEWLNEIKSKVYSAQIKASISVNKTMLSLYWDIGKMIVDKQSKSGWGSSVIEKLSKDLRKEFTQIKGFSRSSLFSMRKWYLFYAEDESVFQLVTQIPWGHNREILNKIKDRDEAIFYIQQTIENGWSRNVLLHHIETNLFERQGISDHNFEATLPKPQSDLAQQTLKDPYSFDFLTIAKKAHEREIENQLVQHITKFLLELGAGFAYVGNQYHIEVSGKNYYLDLLFYHLKLKCYVVIELKVGEFKPEYSGKLNFYLSAVDDILKSESDNPSIGLVLCRTKDKMIVEYALRDLNKPIGVSEYIITEAIPDKLKSSLPSVEELEEELMNGFDKEEDEKD